MLADTAYQNAKLHSDQQNARIKHDKAVERAAVGRMKPDTEFFNAFMDNESFRRLVLDTMFQAYIDGGSAGS